MGGLEGVFKEAGIGLSAIEIDALSILNSCEASLRIPGAGMEDFTSLILEGNTVEKKGPSSGKDAEKLMRHFYDADISFRKRFD